MIYLGYNQDEKLNIVNEYCAKNNINHVIWLSYWEQQNIGELVSYKDIIRYVYFYRLLQEINQNSLVVIDECLRTQDRYDLTYNCIRNYLNQTDHQIIFQYLPIIKSKEDFMILFDFDTKSKWKRRGFNAELISRECSLRIKKHKITINNTEYISPDSLRKKYKSQREKFFNLVQNNYNKDPHIVPRNLHLLSGKYKLQCGGAGLISRDVYVCRNKRLKSNRVVTYHDLGLCASKYTVIDFPHRHIDFTDYLYKTRQKNIKSITTDLPVDKWYLLRYNTLLEVVNETYSDLQ